MDDSSPLFLADHLRSSQVGFASQITPGKVRGKINNDINQAINTKLETLP